MTKKKARNNQTISVFVDDIMTDEFEVVNQQTTIKELAHLMLRRRISSYPIVDDQQDVVGIVTFTDFFELIDKISQNRMDEMHDRIHEISQVPVSMIMSKKIVSLSPDDTLDTVIKLIGSKKVHSFPVFRDGKLVGMVGRHEVLNATFMYG